MNDDNTIRAAPLWMKERCMRRWYGGFSLNHACMPFTDVRSLETKAIVL